MAVLSTPNWDDHCFRFSFGTPRVVFVKIKTKASKYAGGLLMHTMSLAVLLAV